MNIGFGNVKLIKVLTLFEILNQLIFQPVSQL